jgi:hypothetical protein
MRHDLAGLPPRQEMMQSYIDCASVMCFDCGHGHRPTRRPALGGWVHIWPQGNGHRQCFAGPIWETLIAPLESRLEKQGV